MGGGGGSMESGEPEFQIAPMIDCLLVLLIFFMSITSASVLQIDKDIQLPIAEDAKEKQKTASQEGALNVKWDPVNRKSTFGFDGRPYDKVDDLVEVLKHRKEIIQGYHIIIRADQRLPALEIQRTMNVLGVAGFDSISFSTLNK